jgi:hypothetical protein
MRIHATYLSERQQWRLLSDECHLIFVPKRDAARFLDLKNGHQYILTARWDDLCRVAIPEKTMLKIDANYWPAQRKWRIECGGRVIFVREHELPRGSKLTHGQQEIPEALWDELCKLQIKENVRVHIRYCDKQRRWHVEGKDTTGLGPCVIIEELWNDLKEKALKPLDKIDQKLLKEVKERFMEPKDITCEQWREYDFNFIQNGKVENRCYRIENPAQLYVGNTTHRVVDQTGVVHCVPAPGHSGCVLRWKSNDPNKPVSF